MKLDIAGASKGKAYRQSRGNEEVAMLPKNPVGELELTDKELAAICGGNRGDEGDHHEGDRRNRWGGDHWGDGDHWGGDHWGGDHWGGDYWWWYRHHHRHHYW